MIRGQLKPICLKTLLGTYEQSDRSTSRAAGLKKPAARERGETPPKWWRKAKDGKSEIEEDAGAGESGDNSKIYSGVLRTSLVLRTLSLEDNAGAGESVDNRKTNTSTRYFLPPHPPEKRRTRGQEEVETTVKHTEYGVFENKKRELGKR